MASSISVRRGLAGLAITSALVLTACGSDTTNTGDFSLTTSPATVTVPQGGSGSVTVNTSSDGVFASALSIAVTGLPSGVTASSPTISATSSSATLTFTVSSSTATGTTTGITVTASGGGLSHFASLTLTVAPAITKVGHVVVIYMENHSFDNLWGLLPGANGIANATSSANQNGFSGPYADGGLPWPSAFVPSNSSTVPNKPYLIETIFPSIYSPAYVTPVDLVHRFYQEQAQIHGGAMDRFVLVSDSQGVSLGYYDTTKLPIYPTLQQYTVLDKFHAAAFGGSFLNHQWLVAAATPKWESTSTPNLAQSTYNPTSTCYLYVACASGTAPLVVDGQFVVPSGSSDKYLVNTVQPTNPPYSPGTAANKLVPPLTNPTIGDRLTAKGLDWAWFSGGWNEAYASSTVGNSHLFQFHHQPFNYYAAYLDVAHGGTTSTALARAQHLKDEADFDAAVTAGTLPPVSFLKFGGPNNEHPNYADIANGDAHLLAKINAIKASTLWKDTVIIVTYDEFGGFYDHVAPPTAATAGAKADSWGPGSRIPALVVSPYSKLNTIDHTLYDTTSILAFIEKRWSLTPLSTRDAAADPLTGALDFSKNP